MGFADCAPRCERNERVGPVNCFPGGERIVLFGGILPQQLFGSSSSDMAKGQDYMNI